MSSATPLLPKQFDEIMQALAAVPTLAALADPVAVPVWQVALSPRIHNSQIIAPGVQRQTFAPGTTVFREGEVGASACYLILSGRAETLVRQGTHSPGELVAGALFGELALLAQMPQPATIVVAEPDDLVALEIQQAALPLLRSLPAFSALLDSAHHRQRHALLMQELTLLIRLDHEAAVHLSESSRLHLFDQGHALFCQGEEQKRLYLVKRGWGSISQDTSDAQIFGAWQCFGLNGIKEDRTWQESCTLATSSEVLEVALSRLRKKSELVEDLAQALSKLAWVASEPGEERAAQRQLLDTGLVDTQSLLLIDSRLCVRCGNCASACQQTHSEARLTLRGTRMVLPVRLNGKAALSNHETQPWFMATACVHCHSPACLPACPVNAIARRPDARVTLDERKCIGCGDCAASCPYGAISLVPRADTSELRAVHCDLCTNVSLNAEKAKPHLYACEVNCPTGALQQVNTATLAAVRSIPQHNQAVVAEAPSRQTLSSVTAVHLLGLAIVGFILSFTAWTLKRYGLQSPLRGIELNLRWLTGLGGLLCLIITMAYGWRRRRATRRLGALRYWLIAHGYAACLLFGLLMVHHGARRGSPLTTALALATVAAFVSGITMSLVYRLIPGWLTRLEPQPVLPADLETRRLALRGELAELLVQAEKAGVSELRERALHLLHSRRWLWRQWQRRESLEQMISAAQQHFVKVGETENQPHWQRTISIAATVKRIDALLWLHRILQNWWWPHAVTAGLMVTLLLIHLAQVVIFSVR